MKLSFNKKGPTTSSTPSSQANPKAESVARLFGTSEHGHQKQTCPRPVRITSLRDGVKTTEPTAPVPSIKKDNVLPASRPLLIYDPATLGKDAWLASQGSDQEEEELGPNVKVIKTGNAESMLAKAAKRRIIGKEPEKVDYQKCPLEEYGRVMLLNMGLDPESPDAVPDISYKPRPYAQAGLGASPLPQLPQPNKERGPPHEGRNKRA